LGAFFYWTRFIWQQRIIRKYDLINLLCILFWPIYRLIRDELLSTRISSVLKRKWCSVMIRCCWCFWSFVKRFISGLSGSVCQVKVEMCIAYILCILAPVIYVCVWCRRPASGGVPNIPDRPSVPSRPQWVVEPSSLLHWNRVVKRRREKGRYRAPVCYWIFIVIFHVNNC